VTDLAGNSDRWAHVEQLFHAALDQPPEHRAAFLSDACAGDAALRREVESLLDRHGAGDSLFERPALAHAGLPAGPAPGSGPGWSAGMMIGSYRIMGPLGAGGMGEVFRARDTRLEREVAIKVLPADFARDPARIARFTREAKVLASLHHPNICALHDIGDHDGAGYMVMEYLAGETLAARIAKGPLPLEQALEFATQIADALDRAHRAGITHRDVKPHNIMLTRDGVKVLDFGLAKSASKTGPTEETLTNVLTTEGAVMGTPQYMAPEQFEGKDADARSDIWAFGAVLYEMVTGRKAFQGERHSSLMGAILTAEPPPMPATPFTPAWLERLVRRCLAKDPDDRWQSMRDVVLELRAPPQETAAAGPSRMARWPWAVAGVTTLALFIAGVLLYRATRPAPLRPLIRLNVEIAPDTPLARVTTASGIDGHMFALSPDGARMVLTLRGADGKARLHTRLLSDSQVTPLAGTENAYSPFFSPAGDWIAFFAGGKLKKVPVEGGDVVTLCDAEVGFAGSWGDDGNIIAAPDASGILSRVSSAGGIPVPVTTVKTGEGRHRWPQVLPGSQAVLYSAGVHAVSDYNDSNIEAISLKTGERKTILRGGYFARYVPGARNANGSGHLIYMQQSTLFAVPFDPGRLVNTGSPVPILEDVGRNGVAGGDFAIAQNGTFVYYGKAAQVLWNISWVDRTGRTQPLHAPPGEYFFPKFSPDGKRLAFSMNNGHGQDIWVKDLERDTLTRLTLQPGTNSHALWTPDGKYIVFRSSNPAAPGLYGIRSDGSGEASRLTQGMTFEWPHSISPDGKRLAIQKQGDIFTMPVEADAGSPLGFRLGNAEFFVGTPFIEVYAAFSPDGRWLAYGSNETGTYEVYVRPFPGPGGRWQISTGGGAYPAWARDGGELLFETPDSRVMAVSYTARGDSFVVGKPRAWAETRLQGTGSAANYDVAPDGKRLAAFVANQANAEKPPTHLTFLLNFADELQRKVPAAK
jgi:eukaryotic-like serine/threonine-protein kinase